MGWSVSTTININKVDREVLEFMFMRRVGAGFVLAGIAVGSVLGGTTIAQAKVPAGTTIAQAKVPAGTYALKNGYYNETPASTGLRETCDYYTAEANKYLANGQSQSAAQFVAEVNQAKGCTIVYHSYSFAQTAY